MFVWLSSMQPTILPIKIDRSVASFEVNKRKVDCNGEPDSSIAWLKYGQLGLYIKWYPTDQEPALWPFI